MGNFREKKGWWVIGNNAECSKMCGGGTAARLLVVVTRQRPCCVLVRNTIATNHTIVTTSTSMKYENVNYWLLGSQCCVLVRNTMATIVKPLLLLLLLLLWGMKIQSYFYKCGHMFLLTQVSSLYPTARTLKYMNSLNCMCNLCMY